MAQHLDVERRVPRRTGLERPRGRCTHPPAAFGGTGGRRGPHAKCDRHHPRSRRRQRQPPRRGQVELGRFTVRLDHHGPDRPAFDDIGTGTQQCLDIRGVDGQHLGWIDPKLGQPLRIQPSAAPDPAVFTHPQDRLTAKQSPQGDQDGEPGGGTAILGGIGKYLVQGRARQPTLQPSIERRRAQRERRFLHHARQAVLNRFGQRKQQGGANRHVPYMF